MRKNIFMEVYVENSIDTKEKKYYDCCNDILQYVAMDAHAKLGISEQDCVERYKQSMSIFEQALSIAADNMIEYNE